MQEPPVSILPVSVGYSRHDIQHDHPVHEFFYSLNGSGRQFVRTQTYTMQPGELYFFPPGVTHLCSATAEGVVAEGVVVFLHDRVFSADIYGDEESRLTLDHLRYRAGNGQHRVPMTAATSGAVERVMRALAEEAARNTPGHRAALKAGVQQVLLHVLRDPDILPHVQRKLQAGDATERLWKVFHLVENHYMNPLRITEAARAACMSRSHFHAVFRRATGQTFIDYLNAFRVRMAVRMLRESDMRITEVAGACGFNSLSSFYPCFRRQTGMTPRDLRRKTHGQLSDAPG